MIRLVVGYANLFNSVGSTSEGPEVFKPGAFSGILARRGQEVRLVRQHEWHWRIASTTDLRSGFLSLSQDHRGLRFVAELSDSVMSDYIAGELRRGVLWGCSISFVSHKRRGCFQGMSVIERDNVTMLREITLTGRPAYRETWCQLVEGCNDADAERRMRLAFVERSL